MVRVLTVGYGVLCYLVFLVVFGYLVGFLGGFPVPRTVDDGIGAPLGQAIAVNLVLIGLFAAQHTIMARPAFKRWWTRFAPAAVERSTYVSASSILLALLFWQWRAIEGVVWQASGALAVALEIGYFLGLGIVFVATINIDHFALFGLRQVTDAFRGRSPKDIPFHKPGLYRFVRHPIMVGFLIAFWCVPSMSVGHLLFSATASAYIFVAVHFLEERDLLKVFPTEYSAYMNEVGSFLPMKPLLARAPIAEAAAR